MRGHLLCWALFLLLAALAASHQAVYIEHNFPMGFTHHISKRAEDSFKRKGRGSMTYAESLKLEQQGQDHDDGSYDELIYSWMDTIPGKAGKDYPVNEKIPKTSFSCKGRKSVGYYADVETRCQVFHICMPGGHKMSFMCPKGSIFNQKVSVCDWWYDVDCQATTFFSSDNEIEAKESNNIIVDNYIPINELQELRLSEDSSRINHEVDKAAKKP